MTGVWKVHWTERHLHGTWGRCLAEAPDTPRRPGAPSCCFLPPPAACGRTGCPQGWRGSSAHRSERQRTNMKSALLARCLQPPANKKKPCSSSFLLFMQPKLASQCNTWLSLQGGISALCDITRAELQNTMVWHILSPKWLKGKAGKGGLL